MRTGTNVGADGAGSVTTPRLLSVECAVYSPLTDSPWALAYPLSVCPCSRHTRRWPSRNCRRCVRRAFERGIDCTIADTLHGILDGAPWHGGQPYGTTHLTRRLPRGDEPSMSGIPLSLIACSPPVRGCVDEERAAPGELLVFPGACGDRSGSLQGAQEWGVPANAGISLGLFSLPPAKAGIIPPSGRSSLAALGRSSNGTKTSTFRGENRTPCWKGLQSHNAGTTGQPPDSESGCARSRRMFRALASSGTIKPGRAPASMVVQQTNVLLEVLGGPVIFGRSEKRDRRELATGITTIGRQVGQKQRHAHR